LRSQLAVFGSLNGLPPLTLDSRTRDVDQSLVVQLTERRIADRKLTQIKAGEVLGIPQPKVWELVSGGASGVSAERLIHLLNKVGVSVSLAFREEPDWRPGETFIHFDRESDTEMVAAEHDSEVDHEAEADMEISAGPSI
jgi:predicted XRE-type DNA-binding protein